LISFGIDMQYVCVCVCARARVCEREMDW